MTDSPVPPPDPSVTPDPNSPAGYLGPLLNLVTQLSPLWATLAANSGDVKTILTNLDAAWLLPWISYAGGVVGVIAALCWVYRRAIGRRNKIALWWQGLMPWNR